MRRVVISYVANDCTGRETYCLYVVDTYTIVANVEFLIISRFVKVMADNFADR
jgi:hypothetical protein